MSDGDIVERVRDDLDPTPAHAAEWPVSRRDTLRALASVGALAAAPGAASASAGSVIAEEASFSNYGAEQTAAGWTWTIDGAAFAFDGSETVVLDDGREASTFVLPDGREARVVVGPDGTEILARATPDSAIAQYDFREEDGTMPVVDQTGNGNALDTGSYTGVSRTINGNQAAEFDGTNDTVSGTLSTTLTERYVVFAVIQADVVSSGNGVAIWSDDASSSPVSVYIFGSEWRLSQDSALQGSGNATDTPYLLTAVFDATDKLRVNGTEDISGGAGSVDMSAVNLGERANVDLFDGAFGFYEVHNGSVSNGLETREQEIADSWGIKI